MFVACMRSVEPSLGSSFQSFLFNHELFLEFSQSKQLFEYEKIWKSILHGKEKGNLARNQFNAKKLSIQYHSLTIADVPSSASNVRDSLVNWPLLTSSSSSFAGTITSIISSHSSCLDFP